MYNATVEVVRTRDDARILRVRPDRPTRRYQPGQYGSLGLCAERAPDRLIKRPYSLSSSLIDEASGALIDPADTPYHEFYMNRVGGGSDGRERLTPKLFALQIGDRIFCGQKIVGYYTLDQVPPDRHLLLIDSVTGESANNALVNQALREARPIRVCQILAAIGGWRSLYEREHHALTARVPTYRYRVVAGPSYRALEAQIAAWLQDRARAEQDLGFPLTSEHCHVFLCGDPDMIGAPTKQGAWHYAHRAEGLIPLLTAAGFTASTRFKPGTITHEAYW